MSAPTLYGHHVQHIDGSVYALTVPRDTALEHVRDMADRWRELWEGRKHLIVLTDEMRLDYVGPPITTPIYDALVAERGEPGCAA